VKSTGEKGEIVVDYAKLAGKAKGKQDEDKLAFDRHRKLRADPCAFFERVSGHLVEEMKKANVELRKRGAAVLGQNHLPNFVNEIFLTYGTDTLCRVGLGIIGGGCRVTAVISGPPNGYVISRKEYLCDQDAACQEVRHAGRLAVASRPNEIAVDIISGILVGKFD
jgi:hypothetical protein